MAEDESKQRQAIAALFAAAPTANPESLTLQSDDGVYIWAGGLARHLVEALGRQETQEVAAVFATAEELLALGDPSVANLVQIGFFEGVQNVSDGRHVRQEDFEPFLGPLSLAAWLEVNFMWGGSTTPDEHKPE